MAEIKYVSRENLIKVLGKIKATYVVKETGKGLSTNDLTNDLLAKINGMGTVATLNEIAESNLAADLAAKINASNAANHSHANKELLDTYTQTEANLADAVAKKHSHANAAELDLIASGDKAKWDQAVADVATVGGQVNTLIGTDTGKSVRTIANEELVAQLIPGAAKESLDTLGEIAAWIQSHPDDASAMNAAIVALQNQLNGIDAGTGTVKAYVDAAVAALNIGDYAKAADLTALAGRVKTIEDDYLKGADRTALEKSITDGDAATLASAKEYADGLNTNMATRVKAIEDDYVKASEMVAYTDAEIDDIWAAV